MKNHGDYTVTYDVYEDDDGWFYSAGGYITIDQSKVKNFVIQTNSEDVAYIDNIKAFASGKPFKEGATTPYNVQSGTSFAAPFVAAAVGTISNKYENITNALEKKEILLECVRKTDELTDLVATGGTLDLSKLSSIPSLQISTEQSKPTYLKNGNIEIQNIEEGKTYEVNIDGTWKELSGTTIQLEADGNYTIQVREKGSQLENYVNYYCILDTILPKLTVTSEVVSSGIDVTISVSDEGTGVKDENIQYAFTTSDILTDDTTFNTVKLNSNQATVRVPEVNGTYYLYIKPITDNAGNMSSSEEYRYGPYSINNSEPTPSPSASPEPSPSPNPSPSPSPSPRPSPSPLPSTEPSSEPSTYPSTQPSTQPSVEPSTNPNSEPSSEPSSKPGGSNNPSSSGGYTLDNYYENAAKDKIDSPSQKKYDEGGPELIEEKYSPHTGDKIMYYLIMLATSTVSIVCIIKIKKKIK